MNVIIFLLNKLIYFLCYYFRLISEHTPGKKGGSFDFSFGGKLIVPTGLFSKKEAITICAVSPSDRHKFAPIIQLGESIISEVSFYFLFARFLSFISHKYVF